MVCALDPTFALPLCCGRWKLSFYILYYVYLLTFVRDDSSREVCLCAVIGENRVKRQNNCGRNRRLACSIWSNLVSLGRFAFNMCLNVPCYQVAFCVESLIDLDILENGTHDPMIFTSIWSKHEIGRVGTIQVSPDRVARTFLVAFWTLISDPS